MKIKVLATRQEEEILHTGLRESALEIAAEAFNQQRHHERRGENISSAIWVSPAVNFQL